MVCTMPATLDSVSSDAFQLSREQRYTLANRILESIEPHTENVTDSLWDAEIKARIHRFDAGLSKGISGGQVFAELDRKLRP
ncbi:Putative addiction module component [Opitutaceae bacterium TAV1]|nr:Putative addiction module component [Opitutaceae bacterium TAV1]